MLELDHQDWFYLGGERHILKAPVNWSVWIYCHLLDSLKDLLSFPHPHKTHWSFSQILTLMVTSKEIPINSERLFSHRMTVHLNEHWIERIDILKSDKNIMLMCVWRTGERQVECIWQKTIIPPRILLPNACHISHILTKSINKRCPLFSAYFLCSQNAKSVFSMVESRRLLCNSWNKCFYIWTTIRLNIISIQSRSMVKGEVTLPWRKHRFQRGKYKWACGIFQEMIIQKDRHSGKMKTTDIFMKKKLKYNSALNGSQCHSSLLATLNKRKDISLQVVFIEFWGRKFLC